MKAQISGSRWAATVSVLALMLAGEASAQTTDRRGAEQTDPNQPAQGDNVQSAGQSGLKKPLSNSTSIEAQAQTDQSPVTPADVATPEADAGQDVVVTGIRQSLANAQSLKRNADTVVDAITAEDIGALPDRSVNEALQRVPGVAITRFAASNDSQHFSVQGSGVVIRGLSYVRGEFNGRDAFAVGGGREIGFNDIPTEIVGSVEVFKNLTADLIEGGISGSVNINTRKPFDSSKDLLFLSGSINGGDLEGKSAPSVVGLVSKTWDTSGGSRFGVLASGTYSRIRSRADSVFLSSYLPRYNDDKNGNGVQDAGEGRTLNAGTAYQSTVFDTFPVPAGRDFVYAPLGGGSRTQDFDRRRLGFSGALQFENADRTFLATAQFVRTESTEEWLEHTVEPNVYYGDVSTVFPIGAATYDDDGVFTSGTLGKTTGLIQGNRPNGGGYGPLAQFAPNGIFTTQSNRHFYSKSITQDQSLNIKWEPIDRLHLNFDGQYVKSKLNADDDILDTGTFSQVAIDTRGKVPSIQFVTPSSATDANGALIGGQQNTAAYFANPNSIYFRDAFNNLARNDGDEWAFRADASYDFSDGGFLRQLRVGGRYSDRQQTVRSNDYSNWGNVSETWASAGPVSFANLQPGDGQFYNFENFFRGQAVTPPGTTFVPDSVLNDHDALMELLRRASAAGGGSYTPVEDRTLDGSASPKNAAGQTFPNANLIDGYFRPNEIYKNREKTWAAYARIDFGTDDIGGGIGLSGNVGIRYVRTRDDSVGSITYPNASSIFTPVTEPGFGSSLSEYCRFQLSRPNGQGTIPAICTISAAQQANVLAFSNGASSPDTAVQKYDDWLPSLNLKLQVSPTLLFRVAASKALSRPNFGDLRNYIGATPSGGNTAGSFGFQASARNPFLTPVRAKQVDVTAEWYFAKVGSLTGALFYKDLSNIILDNFGYIRTLSNGGQTFDVAVNGPANVSGNSNIKGAEVAYQQTFDFLPGPLQGLGTQLTYTYVKAGKIPNSVPANGPADGSRPPQDITGLYSNLPLQGLSTHNFNASVFYDFAGIYARVAYSWRSKYLLTNRDCCFPFLPVMATASGQMDGSLFYTVNPHFKIGVEAQNLLDTTTKTRFLLNGDGLTAPRSFFKSDRQYTLSVRLTL